MPVKHRILIRRSLRKYARKRLALLPIRPPSKDGSRTGKAPLTGHGHKDAAIGWDAVQKLFAPYPLANIAVATGHRSNLLVLDVDGPTGRKTLAKCEKELGELPETWVSRTGGRGRHYYFEWPANLVFTRDTAGKVFGPNVDVLGDGSYAVLPPSRHSSGAAYAWIGDGVEGDLAALPLRWRK
jgi:putative DNA primase/helicase